MAEFPDHRHLSQSALFDIVYHLSEDEGNSDAALCSVHSDEKLAAQKSKLFNCVTLGCAQKVKKKTEQQQPRGNYLWVIDAYPLSCPILAFTKRRLVETLIVFTKKGSEKEGTALQQKPKTFEARRRQGKKRRWPKKRLTH